MFPPLLAPTTSVEHQIVGARLSKFLEVDLHAQAESALDVIVGVFEQLLETAGERWKCALEIGKADRLPHQLLVHHVRKTGIKDYSIIDGSAEDNADEFELTLVLKRRAVEPVKTRVFFVHEHAIRDVEDLCSRDVHKS